MILIGLACDRCIHKRGKVPGSYKIACDAFPEGVPREAYFAEKDESYICANNVKYEPDPEKQY